MPPPGMTDYTYAFGENGFVLNTDFVGTLPFVDVTSITGLDGAPIRVVQDEHQGIDGTFIDAIYMSARTIVITGTLYAANNDPETLPDLLRAQFGPGSGIQPFYYQHPSKPMRFINAQGGGAKYDVDAARRLGISNLQLTLLASDPYIYDYPPYVYQVTFSPAPAFQQINTNATFESGITPWVTGNGGTIAQSSTIAHTGSFSLRLTPNGSTANPFAASENDAVTPGQFCQANIWVNCPVGWATGASANIDWYTSGSVFISTTTGVVTALTSTWTNLVTNGQAPATAAFGRVSLFMAGTPGATVLTYLDDAYLYAAPGLGFPLGFNTGFGSAALNPIAAAINNGTHEAYPIITLLGPLLNPVITDNFTGKTMRFKINLASRDTLVIDCRTRTVLLNGRTSARYAMQGMQWFTIPALSSNSFNLNCDSGSGQMMVTTFSTYY
jgi:hypothetical protein